MPTTINLPGGGTQLGRDFVRSVVYTAYASVTDRTEVAAAAARYFEGHFFSANNGGGTDFGQVSVDTSDLIIAHFGRANIADTLAEIFPPPGPD
jgi:hypothetical protein